MGGEMPEVPHVNLNINTIVKVEGIAYEIPRMGNALQKARTSKAQRRGGMRALNYVLLQMLLLQAPLLVPGYGLNVNSRAQPPARDRQLVRAAASITQINV